MFKSAATKIAHNSTLPALAGNHDLRLLQDVITSQKTVLQSLLKLSIDLTKSSEALKCWGIGEGEDLADTLSACTTLMGHFSTSLASFSNNISHIRECLKSVRSREEALDELHRRRKSLLSKADSAEKKLNRMNLDHKNFRQQTDVLLGFRESIRSLDVEIMNEEATLSDWKRLKVREWMGVLFGGLLECSEKGNVVATFGRSIISYIPLDRTEPGLARVPYSGHAQVEPLLVEAERKLHNITFLGDTDPNHPGDPNQEPYRPGEMYGIPTSPPTTVQTPDFSQSPASLPPPSFNSMDEFGAYAEPRGAYSLGPGHSENALPSEHIPDGRDGMGISPVGGGKYSTYPVKPSPRPFNSGFHPDHRPDPSQGSDFSSSSFLPRHTATRNPNSQADTKDQSFSSSVAAALGPGWNMEGGTPRLNSSPGDFYQQTQEPPPSYIPAEGPPPGAAPAVTPGAPDTKIHRPLSHQYEAPKNYEVPGDDHDGHSDRGLAYMSQDNSEGDDSRGSHEDRRVRFGSVRDVDTEIRKRKEMVERDDHLNNDGSRTHPDDTPQQHTSWTERVKSVGAQPTTTNRSPSPPSFESQEYLSNHKQEETAEMDESSLNALAAREITIQMERMTPPASPLAPPFLPFAGRRSVSPRPPITTDSLHVRERDNIYSPPPVIGRASPQIHEAQSSREEIQVSTRLSMNLSPSSRSESPSSMSRSNPNDTAYQTPPEYLSNTPMSQANSSSASQASPALTASPASSPISSPTTKTISAAAFRRPNMRPIGSSSNSVGDSAVADTSPLNVRKKSFVPSVGSAAGGPRAQPPGRGASLKPTAPVGQGTPSRMNEDVNRRSRAYSTSGLADNHGVLDDDFDYISAYVEDGRRSSQNVNGYNSGRFATNLEGQE